MLPPLPPSHPADRRRDLVGGLAFGVGAGALWGFVFLAPQLLPMFSPLALSAARYVLYGALSLAIVVVTRPSLLRDTSRHEWLALVLLALPGNVVYFLFLAGAVQRAGVAPVSLIVGMVPVTATLLAAIDRRRDVDTVPLRRLLLPLTMAVAGAVCIYLDAPASTGHGDRRTHLVGLLFAFGALISWTIFAVENARFLRAHPQISSRSWSLLSGVATGVVSLAVLVPPLLWSPALLTTSSTTTTLTGTDWWRFAAINAGVALGASVVGNGFWNAASRRLPLTLSGQMIVFETLFALAYGFAVEGRGPHALEVLAAALLIGGVVLSARRH